ncbi:MAG: hypothetical protein JWP04_3806 [Belnapia sp.]|nr:hypothetical protein [Belnapia sp.]
MGEAKQTKAQTITAVCEKNWDAKSGDCSGFVKVVASDLGLSLTGQANAIIKHIRSNWSKATNGADAASKAAAGNLVIGGLEATPNGHVVVVVDGPLNREKYPTAYWGKLGGVGKKKTTINFSWNSTDRDLVEYYYSTIGQTVLAGANPSRVINWDLADLQRRISSWL